LELAHRYNLLVTLEENALTGAAGSSVNEFLHANALESNLLNLGIPDAFVEHGIHGDQLASIGLDPKGLYSTILNRINLESSAINPNKISICAPLPSSQL
jgi:1-deoxy-D-xylulose-5-phosphate synthase